jgi:hypothetical protein
MYTPRCRNGRNPASSGLKMPVTLTRSALIDWYVDHPEEKDASWFRRLYGSARCMPADDLHLKKN